MKYKFLIYISYSYAVPIGEPLEKEILRQGHSVKWFSELEDGKSALSHKENVLTIKQAVAYQPDIVLTATDDVADFLTGIKVQIFHGFFAQKRPGKNNTFYHFRIRDFFDLYCTQGPNTTRVFKEKAQQYGFFRVEETGWSKVDPLFPLEEKTLTSIPTVMIASTFSQKLSLAYRQDVFDVVKNLSASGDYKFKMVLHPKLPTEIKEKWKNLSGDNFTYYNTTDLIPLFKQADFMFADTTSAIQEFILQKKPIVTFRHTIEHDYLLNVTEAKNISEAFKKAANPSEKLLQNIENFIAELHPYYDGKSSARVINASINFLNSDKSDLKSKPFNFLRKYKVRKRLDYFPLKTYNKAYQIEKSKK
ncbi:UDP-N-acetylglucosamine 2-epimerase [Haloflavibacter putidus]|uniref:CDP-glycerol glycerophosphotransferase n=1 Tax=Haloflavibacter putidus TaxID=2576776 RepID=A0A508A2P0_9FLAO|nr:UDP-N-acetylglucosamine 2-epimerase [Haloflavibacter putidus]TQD40102.1 CDP-glycerol glycerophosphotransferase [Haloflavibacter putidus]